jgi:dihydropteridine reductase
MQQQQKNALVLGSSGTLGSIVSRYLGQEMHMTVIGVDLLELPNESDWAVDGFISIPQGEGHQTLASRTKHLTQGVSDILGEDEALDVIVVASGGWEGDPSFDDDVEKGALAYGSTMDRMLKANLFPVVAAGHVAQRFMTNQQGLFVVMGATAALNPTPGMLAYGLSKAAAHHFVTTFGSMSDKALKTKAQRKEVRKLVSPRDEYLEALTVVGILPTMIDTPANRDNNPDADFDKWVKPLDIAMEIGRWIELPDVRPHSGSLVKVQPSSSGTGANFVLVR